ncbi:MAG: TRAM domain-containing protein, partial [Candidatus Aenigmarchaeota archaeon]|nr:TRAM domain-containing protein [Candidatus Aenigmarchaeota archaeon]
RNFAYKQVVVDDGQLGKFVDVEIIEARKGYLIGRRV